MGRQLTLIESTSTCFWKKNLACILLTHRRRVIDDLTLACKEGVISANWKLMNGEKALKEVLCSNTWGAFNYINCVESMARKRERRVMGCVHEQTIKACEKQWSEIIREAFYWLIEKKKKDENYHRLVTHRLMKIRLIIKISETETTK